MNDNAIWIAGWLSVAMIFSSVAACTAYESKLRSEEKSVLIEKGFSPSEISCMRVNAVNELVCALRAAEND